MVSDITKEYKVLKNNVNGYEQIHLVPNNYEHILSIDCFCKPSGCAEHNTLTIVHKCTIKKRWTKDAKTTTKQR